MLSKTPKDCEQFAINVEARGKPELARAARRRAIELRALEHNAHSDPEREALEAVYAYERVLSENAGKKIKATRTWQMIKRYGLILAVEHVVSRRKEAKGYFSGEAAERSRARLRELTNLLDETAC